jgi:hypothetical protein
VYLRVLRHRENHSSNCSNWLRELRGFASSDVKRISVVVAVVMVSSPDEETRRVCPYSLVSKRRYEPVVLVAILQANHRK